MSELKKIDACAKRPIDVWTNYLYYPLSIRLVYAIRNTSITPNALTLASLLLALVGCALFAQGGQACVWAGLLLVQLSYVVDCADGQLARYKQLFSPLGGWLDQTADRVKEFAVYFSLAYGYSRLHPGPTDIWMWAMVALFALYMLEYLGQIDLLRRLADATLLTGPVPPEEANAGTADTFSKLRRIRAYIPFRSFIIGEQYFTMLVFLIFDAVHALFVFVSVLGLLMVVYRIAVSLYKFRRLTSQQPR
jgi:archaetidylinositol phosphate synthase